MKILFLSHYFPPEVNAPATRTYEHCKQWVKNGHDVTVVTCAPSHPQGVVYEGYKNKLFHCDVKDGINVIRIWTYVTANEGFIKRTLNYVSFLVSGILISPFLSKTDVVITTSPQFFNGLVGYFVSRIKRVPWVLEIRDLWPESILAVGAIKNRFIIKMLEYLETFAYRKADRIVCVTDSFVKHIQSRGGQGKIEVVKNGVDLTQFQPGQKAKKNNNVFEFADKFVVSYVGTHGMAHGLDTVLVAAGKLKHKEDIVFLLVGDGAEKVRLKKSCLERELHNVILIDQQPKERMPHIWENSDVSLVLLRKLDLFKTVIPSKIFESMAMMKPIILGVSGESEQIIKQANSGICIEPENSEQLANAVVKLFNSHEECLRMGSNGRAFVKQHFNRTMLARRYEKVLIDVVNC